MEAGSGQKQSNNSGTSYFLQHELARLREAKTGGNCNRVADDAGVTMNQCRMLGREKEMPRTQLIHEFDRTHRLRQVQQEPPTSQSSFPQAEGGIDSVRLPSETLRRAVWAAFGPGRFVLEDGKAVMIEYANDFIVVRGSQSVRNAFMALLVRTLLKHVESMQQKEQGDSCNERQNLSCTHVASPSMAEVGAPGEDDPTGTPLYVLRRAIGMEKMEREKAQLAQHDAEHECALLKATWEVERTRYREEKQQLEGRVQQLETELKRERDNLQNALHRLQERDPQKRDMSGDRHVDNVEALSFQRGGDISSFPGKGGKSETHGVPSVPLETDETSSMLPRTERNDITTTNTAGKKSHANFSSLVCRKCEKTVNPLQREMELLRSEKDRLSRQLQLSVGVVDELRNRLQNVEAAAAHLFASVLSSSEFVLTIPKGEAAAPRPFLYRCGGVDVPHVQALVQSLSADSTAAPPVEQRLAELTSLLEIERRALKAALEFAVHERDAAFQANREETLLTSPERAAVPTPLTKKTNSDGRTANTSSATTLEKENEKLRTELRRSFEDIRQLGQAVERSHAMYQALQEKLRAADRCMREKEKTARSMGHQQEIALMAAIKREKSLELQLQRIRQEKKMSAVHHSNTAIVHPEKEEKTFVHLVTTPSKKSCVASILTPDESRNKYPFHHRLNTDTRESYSVSRNDGLHSGPCTTPTPLKMTGAATPFSPSILLRRENFEEALNAIHPS
ncbi:hypothetical protein MOQ_001150 [Trypanosoma cruzi marinkellei]|uniref:Uncharacterized protein n=1 Tax=Trypanosoma cruzi marinkellei TaxID=85056 RepID=K2PC78_TRYCR|nr:hypothetical protein MOQ_001150 [Trypanosoma cruzi marinkellei]